MCFKRARSQEQKDIRINQIAEATMKLYDKMPFDKITLASIAKDLNFSRTNIYKYISTKEEIFLLIILKDVKRWICDLEVNFENKSDITVEEFAEIWSKTLFEHKRLIELFSVLYSIIEKNVSVDRLVKYKKELFKEFECLYSLIQILLPELPCSKIDIFLRMQLYQAIGLYPATQSNEIQNEAIKKSGISYVASEFVPDFSMFILFVIKGLMNK